MVNLRLKIRYSLLDTPWGEMFVAATERGFCYLSLRRVEIDDLLLSPLFRKKVDLERDDGGFAEFNGKLKDYLEGKKVFFSEPLDLRGATPFQRAVWERTGTIPYGEVRSYDWLAKRIGHPQAARAVGRSLALNPLPILIPCHRVVRKNGGLGGFSGGSGLKRRLLEVEGVQLRLKLDEVQLRQQQG